jgi:hypothetical protein
MNIEVFIRHCNISANSINKNRPAWFSREKCWNNLNNTKDEATNITVMFDGSPTPDHFLYGNSNVVCKQGGDDGRSFLNLVDHVFNLNIHDDTILYFLEDDYYHKPGWPAIMREAFQHIGAEYVTLYDHNDKYTLPMYQGMQSSVMVTPSTHWRTTPSTTNTYAMLAGTFKKHYSIHKEYCDLVKGFTRDHDKFLRLWQEGSNLISCMPGYSTHCEVEYLSPCINWDNL